VALQDMAEELGVDWNLLGTIAKAGREVRITTQLVDAASDENRWARSYIQDGRRLLSRQAEVAAEVAQEVANVVRSA
jgi:TolB-like protein